MVIQLPPDVEASIRRKVEGGQFPDAADVVREAMRLLDEQEQRLDALRAKLHKWDWTNSTGARATSGRPS